jgi:hypothetical protein
VLLVGSPSSFVGLHKDICGIHSWITLGKGKKLYFLFPPESNAETLFGQEFHFSAALKSESKEMREKIRLAKGMVLYLDEGKTIFIPSGW